jgi:hypothetical protein
VELVEADEASRRVTFRDTKTGKTLTFDADDLEDGRISFETEEGTVTVGAEGGEEGGSLSVTTGEGTAVFRGGSAATDVPDWVVRYPGAELTGTYSVSAAGTEGGSFGQLTDDGVGEVFEYFQRELKQAGFELQVHTFSGGGSEHSTLVATSSDPPRNEVVSLGIAEGRTQVAIQYGSGGR